MDALQARFRDKASEILQNTPTITVAMGRGRTFAIETCYVVGNSDELHCIVKPNPAIVEAVRDDACVAFTVNQGFPTQMLQGMGRAFFLGGLDLHPQIREQTLAKIPEATAFLTTIRNLGVVKILPDQIAVTDDTNLGLGPRPVYIPEAARALPDRRRRWMQALGIASWPLVLIPVVIAALLARHVDLDVAWWLLVPVCLVAMLIHAGTALLATYTGFRRHINRSTALGANRVLQDGLLSTRQVLEVGLLCMALGSVLGLFLVGLHGTPLLAIGFIGVLGGLLYAGWPLFLPYRLLEDVAVLRWARTPAGPRRFRCTDGQPSCGARPGVSPPRVSRRVHPSCQPSTNIFCRCRRQGPHPCGGVRLGESAAALLCPGRSAVYSRSAVDPREGAAGVVLVDISEPALGRSEHPLVVACDSGPDAGARWPRSADGPGVSGLRRAADLQSDPGIVDGATETQNREREQVRQNRHSMQAGGAPWPKES